MEAICSSETSVDFQRTTLRYVPEDSTLHNHRCENLNSYTIAPFIAEGRNRLVHEVLISNLHRDTGYLN
jgi:hypothetical protein